MPTRRVLIVDDEAEVRSALADILRAMRIAISWRSRRRPTAWRG